MAQPRFPSCLVVLVAGCASLPAAAPGGVPAELRAVAKTKRCRLTRVLDEAALGLAKRTSPYRSLSVARDGALLVDAALVDVAAGRVVRTFESRPGAPIVQSSLSLDGRRALVFEGAAPGEVAGAVWDRETGERLRALTLGRELDRGWVIALALAREGEVALLGDSVDSLWLWRFGSAEPPRRIARGDGAIVAADLSADGRLGIAVDASGRIEVYDLETGRAHTPLEVASWPGDRNPDLVSFIAPGEVVVLDESARLSRRDVTSGKTLRATPEVPQGVRGTSLRASAFSRDRRTLLRVSADQTRVAIVDVETLAETDWLELGVELAAQAVAFAPDGRAFYVETVRGKLLAFELE